MTMADEGLVGPHAAPEVRNGFITPEHNDSI